MSTPQWPDVEAHPPGGHECPPDRVAMLKRLEEISGSYNTRLANQRQVIENLSEARKAALDALAAWREFGQYIIDNEPTFGAIHARVTNLLADQEKKV